MSKKVKSFFTIEKKLKPIPYDGVSRPESFNYGFKNLRQNLKIIAEIPETKDNNNLFNALTRLNGSLTPFFTVGCEKSFNFDQEKQSFWARGYLEFSFNYIELVCDAQSYFKLFFDFNEYIHNSEFDFPVDYHWELTGAQFLQSDCMGFTVGVWISVGHYTTESETKERWGDAVDFLVNFLMQCPPVPLTKIY